MLTKGTALSVLGVLIAGLMVWATPGAGASDSPPADAKGAKSTKAPTLTIVYTISNVGYIEPCG